MKTHLFFRFFPALLSMLAVWTASAQPPSATPAPAKEDPFDARMEKIHGDAQAAAMKAAFAVLEKGLAELKKDHPGRPEIYELQMQIASRSEPEKARQLAGEIVVSAAAKPEVKESAKDLLKRLEAIGKPLDIKFTALDGREVDLSKMKGKVVLVDFWATWCGPCVRELPNVQAAYEQLHGKGFEIIGISFDQKKFTLKDFIEENKMPWPQYFDGKGWANELGKQYGIKSIPAMWLVDKQGKLRDVEARDGLVEKIEKLLAEPQP